MLYLGNEVAASRVRLHDETFRARALTTTLRRDDGAAPTLGRLDRQAAEQALSRAAGAPLVGGNDVRLLHNASGNYPAWLEAIEAARRSIFFETYIWEDDIIGRRFAEALAERARAGVRVRVVHDWLGAGPWEGRRLWRLLSAAGVDVRCFNRPRLDRPGNWLARDHRKMIAVDGAVGFVSGLCVSDDWMGNPGQGIEEWRDVGVAVRGPAIADIERAFAQTWDVCGDPLPDSELTNVADIPLAGDVGLRVIAASPSHPGVYAVDQLVATVARKTLWVADAYFVALPLYVQALRAAAEDGVDVRLLVPGSSDVPIIRPLTRAGYRPLLKSGVRVFEWNGPMMHAKTAVADGRWARVGSTNLNVASWMGNWELDVAVEHDGFAAEMAQAYEADLERATEIVLSNRRVQRVAPVARRALRSRLHPHATGARAAAGALRLVNTFGAVVSRPRELRNGEPAAFVAGGFGLLLLAVAMVLWPLLIAVPMAVVALWLGTTLIISGTRRLLKRRRRDAAARAASAVDSPARAV